MMLSKNKNILIVGLGLIGGSYAMALKKQGFKITAINDKQDAIDYALANNIIDEGYIEVKKELLEKFDFIIFTLYPTVFIDWIKKYGKLIKSGTIITDTTGVKQNVINTVQELLNRDVEFISAHPMAGKEASGVKNSSDEVFKNANYIVVPTEKNTKKAINACKSLGEILGFKKISCLSIKEHDEMIGFLSQLTHCIAVSLMTCNNTENLEKYTGDSFRDLTRIAKINENMWCELFLMNKEILLKQIDIFIEEFTSFRNMLEQENTTGLKEKMRLSTIRRTKFDE